MTCVDSVAIIVPLKAFELAKSRLRRGGVHDVETRLRDMAAAVLAAGKPRPVYVACESDEVADFALAHGAQVLRSPVAGLNEAAAYAHARLSSDFERVMIVHGDLRLPAGLGSFEPPAAVTIVTDHHGTGTNVLVVPTGVDFRFAFGVGSAAAHVHEARRLDLSHHVVTDSPWRFDVDEVGDMVD